MRYTVTVESAGDLRVNEYEIVGERKAAAIAMAIKVARREGFNAICGTAELTVIRNLKELANTMLAKIKGG